MVYRSTKWNREIGGGKSIGEMIYQNNPKALNALDPNFSKKNRVTVAHNRTPEGAVASLRSPLFNDNISQNDEESKLQKSVSDATNDEITIEDAENIRYSKHEADPETLKWLRDQEEAGDVVHTYKSLALIDGKLYPPMATKTKNAEGKYVMANAMELGTWA